MVLIKFRCTCYMYVFICWIWSLFTVDCSMGGSVAVHVAAKKAIPKLAGLIVVDVVEGTAIASLIHMQKTPIKQDAVFFFN